MWRKYPAFLLFVLTLFPIPTPGWGGPPTLVLQFGINSTDSPKVVAQKILPILKVIEEELEKQINRSVQIKFKVFRTYDESIQAFVDSKVDFGRLGPSSYIIAKRKNPKIRLLAMENKKGKRTFNGLIIIRKNSPIKILSELIVFGEPLRCYGGRETQTSKLN
jgi:phosphonate transport system substrate-binding protein